MADTHDGAGPVGAGPEGEVLKLLPPLTIDESHLEEGLAVIAGAVAEVADGVEGPSTDPTEEVVR